VSLATEPVARRAPPPTNGHAPAEERDYVVSAERLAQIWPDKDARARRKEIRNLLADERVGPQITHGPIAKPENVRAADPDDERDLYDLAMLDLKENAEHIAPISPNKVVALIHHGTRRQGGMIGVIDGPEGGIVGAVCLVPSQWWWSEGYYLQDVFTCVHPDHRKSDYAKDLINFACWASDEWTRGFGYRVYTLTGVLGTKRVRDKIRFFRRMLTLVGAAVLYPAPPEGGSP